MVGDINTISNIQNDIAKLANKERSECLVCESILLLPHSLFNCKHTFCKYCIISSIRTNSDDVSKYPIKCPQYEECKTYVNIKDLKCLFDQEEFDKMCDRGVQKMIDNTNYHGCNSTDCEMIFEVKESLGKGSYKCSLCAVSYCYKCMEIAHKGFTCEQNKHSKDPNS